FKGLHFPKMELRDVIFVSLTEEDYPILKGDILMSDGIRIKKEDFKEFFSEYTVEYSTAKRSKRKDGKVYVTGPISRFNNCYERLSPIAREYAEKLSLEPPETNPYKSILIRMVEIVHSLERSIRMVKDYRKPKSSQVEHKIVEWTGYGVSEAPRGILWHSYSFDKEGRVESADIVPPTSQNQDAMELSLLQGLEEALSGGEERIRDESEKIIRCFDPCISCATHFLNVHISSP
ncbi:MAG: nickel-dependent hydrogenase large subunit, partial [Aquificaceae bacterium]